MPLFTTDWHLEGMCVFVCVCVCVCVCVWGGGGGGSTSITTVSKSTYELMNPFEGFIGTL